MTIQTAQLPSAQVEFTEQGAGPHLLLLHGGGGPQTVSAFGELMAENFHVYTPTHPGFGGTPRPDAVRSPADLARIYVALLDGLDLEEVIVVGNSVGGWIAAEMALLGSTRIDRVVLVDAVGIEVPGHPVVDFFALSFPEIAQLSYHNPDGFLIDPDAMPPAAREMLAGNRAALTVYAGEPSMVDLGLRARLADVTLPTLVVWGDSDRIVDPAYGRAYADAIPGARFHLLPDTGHLPQLESPQQLATAVREFSSRAGLR